MKIQVTGEVGRECNPHYLFQNQSEDDEENLHEAVSNTRHENFEQSVQSFPAPGIEDGEHEAELVWQFKTEEGEWLMSTTDIGDYTFDDYARTLGGAGIPTRQIWKLTPKAK